MVSPIAPACPRQVFLSEIPRLPLPSFLPDRTKRSLSLPRQRLISCRRSLSHGKKKRVTNDFLFRSDFPPTAGFVCESLI